MIIMKTLNGWISSNREIYNRCHREADFVLQMGRDLSTKVFVRNTFRQGLIDLPIYYMSLGYIRVVFGHDFIDWTISAICLSNSEMINLPLIGLIEDQEGSLETVDGFKFPPYKQGCNNFTAIVRTSPQLYTLIYLLKHRKLYAKD